MDSGARSCRCIGSRLRQRRAPGGVRPRFVIALGLPAAEAGTLAAARGVDLAGRAAPIGLGCRACTRVACLQRSAAPAGRAAAGSERERGVTAFGFAGD
ncbi:short-chain fatty acyl-CoA regulator family protein [Sphingomonas trueperi]|uniref:short-chain fatty acyl-CoA regulator family protein n=1 Tax=Sphingomonas trueperi TaxID=53317 RepID=UPI0033984ED9